MNVAVAIMSYLMLGLITAVNASNIYGAMSTYKQKDNRLYDAFLVTVSGEFSLKKGAGVGLGAGTGLMLAYVVSQKRWYEYGYFFGSSGTFSRGVFVSVGAAFNVDDESVLTGYSLSSNAGFGSSFSELYTFPLKKGLPTLIQNTRNWLAKAMGGRGLGVSVWSNWSKNNDGTRAFGIQLFDSFASVNYAKEWGYSTSLTYSYLKESSISQYFNDHINPSTLEDSGNIGEVLNKLIE